MTKATQKNRVLRVAYLTEMHLQPERGAFLGVSDCLRQVYALPDPPDFILNGGDLIMDAVAEDEARARLQFDLWDEISAQFDRIPIHHCLGNHDIWGWHRKSGAVGSEPLFGKKLAQERLHLTSPYYYFDRAGWRFIVLDSVQQGGADDYEARLDAAQFDWLSETLAATPPEMFIVVVSHVPILGGGCLFFSGTPGEREKSGNWIIPGSWLHLDARALHDLWVRFPRVRLCLAGHTHLSEQLTYDGLTYINGGSVSGRWWRGAYHHTPPGFGLLDLFADGTFCYAYTPTAWQSNL